MNRNVGTSSAKFRWKSIVFAWGGWIGVLGMCLFGPFILMAQQTVLKTAHDTPHSQRTFVEAYQRQVHSWSPQFFKELLGLELQVVQGKEPNQILKPSVIWQVGFDHATHVKWGDPRSYLTYEWSWLRERNDQLLWGQATANHAPLDAEPSKEQLHPIPRQTSQPKPFLPKDQPTPNQRAEQTSVFIYHSHNRESWLPELRGKSRPEDAYDPNVNVTMLGDRLAFLLNRSGIGAISNRDDYPSMIESFRYGQSYKYSKQTVLQAIKSEKHLDYFFDLHRDSQGRKTTTLVSNGKEWAQVYFIIGKKNPNWHANMQFAKRLHNAIEQRVPGISRGVWGKAGQGNAEYNQSLSENSVLIEIGGYANTRAECNRTLTILAEAIVEIIQEDQLAKMSMGN